jgi:phenylacetate-CoA ligase
MRVRAKLLRFARQKTATKVDSVLCDLLRDASRWVPFYRGLYSGAGVDIASFRGVCDLATLPLTTKQALLKGPERDRVREGRDLLRCARTSTSGSTGQPFTIYLSRAELYFRRYTLLLSLGHYGHLPLPLRVADVGPMVPHHQRSIEQRVGLVTLLRIPGDWTVARQREALLRYRPTILEGYPTCLEILAESLSEREAREIRPRLIVCRGETLRPAARGLLKRTFGSPIANLYNCEEIGNIAWECPDNPGRFHVNSDTCVCEVLPDGMSQAHGNVVVTNLYNRTMPFIRYRLGDTAARISPPESVCSCGGGIWLEDLAARDDDFVVLPDGRRISPRVPGNTVYNALRCSNDLHLMNPDVRRYQIVQDAAYALHVRLQSQGPPDLGLWNQISSAIGKACPGLPCTVEEMDTPELTAGGKFKIVISRVPTEQ